jgi:Family of unknown function (DUF6502)
VVDDVTPPAVLYGGPSPTVSAAIRRLLRPIIRFVLGQGVTYPALAAVFKGVYIQVAREEFGIDGRQPSDSRIALITGINRKDLKRRGNRRDEADGPPAGAPLGAQLAARWAGDPAFLDENGLPAPLPKRISEGGGQSFEALVESVSKDIRSRVILDDWLHLGVASLDAAGRVCLNADAFVPERGLDEKLFFFGRNVHDHMAGAVHNLRGAGPPFFERTAYYEGLAPDSIEELRRLSADLGMTTLRTVNRRAAILERRDARRPARASMRMNFGGYVFVEPMPIDRPATPGRSAPSGGSADADTAPAEATVLAFSATGTRRGASSRREIDSTD